MQTVDWADRETYLGVIRAVEEVGKKRYSTQGTMSDADFFAGALAAMQALGLTPEKWPSSWTLGLMFGRKSPLRDLPTLVPGTPILPTDGTKKDAVRAWVLAQPDGEHGGRRFAVVRVVKALAEQGITLSKGLAYRYLDDMCDEGLLHKSAGGAAYWWRVVGEQPAEQPAATRQDKVEKIRQFVATWPANKMFTTSRVEGELWQYNLPRGLVTKALRQMEKEDLVRQVSSTTSRIRWARITTDAAQAPS